ncbi:MAG: hypothetical protein OFPII_13660 [Osedax symbiont Rs1]|nr:MAG: hypothetical protein OFPII_13660 [Osedax symbiont Rs1]
MKIFFLTILLITSGLVWSEEEQVNAVNQYILNTIKVHVWSGFETADDIQEIISDLLEEGADQSMLRQSVSIELNKKYQAEKSWPQVTDVDRLDKVFQSLNSIGILCLHNAGYTMSDGHDDSHDALIDYPKGQFFGYCFYHRQDLERAISGGGLRLAYDHVRGDVPEKIKVAQAILQELEKAGFTVDWDQTTEQRINIPNFDWKNRAAISR